MADKAREFKDRYVLGEGYPWALGIGPYYEINLHPEPYVQGERVPLDWPDELGSNLLPKYRLGLERVCGR